MIKVEVRGGEKLNGLGIMMKRFIEAGVDERKLEGFECSLVISTDYDIAITLFFENGELAIQNGTIEKSDLLVEGGLKELGDLCTRKINPVWAMLTKKIRLKGNPLKFLKVRRILKVS